MDKNQEKLKGKSVSAQKASPTLGMLREMRDNDDDERWINDRVIA